MSDIKAWLEDKLLQLNVTDTMDQPQGFTRLSYTPEEKEAHEAFQTIATSLGLEVSTDEAGNQWALWTVDASAPTVAVGSHLDTVHSGGGYDGVAGVLSGLAAVNVLKTEGFTPKKNIAIICFASEESARYGVSTIGSKALTGWLDKHDLADVKDAEGMSIQASVEAFGLDWEIIENADLSPDRLESFLELHIEQGTQIETSGSDIGVVRGVACPTRLTIKASGMANHTGTTPMDNRRDAFAAIAPVIPFVEEEARSMNQHLELPLVATVSTVQLKPNAMNVIPGEVELGIDIRSVDDEAKRKLAETIKAFCRKLEEKRDVTITVDTLVDNDSVFLSEDVREKLMTACQHLGYQPLEMDSGAGHDVMNMATRFPSGLLFIPCKEGISHHPKEYATLEDIEKGTQTIAHYLKIETGDDSESTHRSDWSARLS
ncbi:M20 family metallo-hydrolase [Thalassobacillus sp. CUG 92003]|uniref:M20 family metallo-hydrolase n=1 Tax=Thalassobacillus sp. CUG 92003 TaxID=2736641 RepID=UPI0015E68B90|nr:M20 family metallo-hydrolase [Thalassobacillus sp. CUG 92003]